IEEVRIDLPPSELPPALFLLDDSESDDDDMSSSDDDDLSIGAPVRADLDLDDGVLADSSSEGMVGAGNCSSSSAEMTRSELFGGVSHTGSGSGSPEISRNDEEDDVLSPVVFRAVGP